MRPVVLTATGQRAEVSSTTMPKLSSSGSMRRISSVSSPCSRVLTSEPSSRDSPEPLKLSSRRPASPTTTTWVTSPHAPLTLEPLLEPRSISIFPSLARTWKSLKRLPINSTSRSAVAEVSTLTPATASSISPTDVDSAAPRRTSFRICTTVSRP